MLLIDKIRADTSNDHWLNVFFDEYGTHAIDSAEMGDKFVATTNFDMKESRRQEDMGRGVDFSASASAFGFTISGGYSDRTDT